MKIPLALEKCIGVEKARLLLNGELLELQVDGQRGYEVAQSIAQALQSEQCKLQTLHLINKIGAQGAQSLAQALQSEQCKLQTLYLSYNEIGAQGAHSLAQALQSEQCKLQTLDVRANGIGNTGAESLAQALQSEQCKLQTLNLSWNGIGAGGAQSLAQALQSEQCKLQTLDLRENGIGDELQTLNLFDNKIGAQGAHSLAQALQSEQCKLQTLNLSWNGIGAGGAQSLAQALQSEQCKLQTLDLHANGIGNTGAESLAQALQSEQCKLQTLNLSENGIGDELQTLNLFDNKIGAQGAHSLAQALQSEQCKLQTLYLSYNEIGAQGAHSLAQALQSEQCKLQTLDVHANGIGNTGAESLAQALQSEQCKLQTLDVRANGIGNTGAESLAQALQSEQCNLLTLDLSENGIGDEGAESLAKALKIMHCKLQNLRLGETNLTTRIGQIQMLNALKTNFILKDLSCDWESKLLEAEAKNLLQRNEILSGSDLANQERVLPNAAKLFICGDSGVGKSTIRKGLTKNRFILKLQSCGRSNSTRGMDLTTLQFGKQQLQICDLAGQQEYHAFHHLFLKGSDKDLFLVVCKAPNSSTYQQFQTSLDYWLRFIASHRSPSSLAMPKVLIVVNYFTNSDQPLPTNMKTHAHMLLERYLGEYSKFLDFGTSEQSVFGIIALKPQQLKPLKLQLKDALNSLLKQRPQIPQLCDRIINELNTAFKGGASHHKWFFSRQNHCQKVISFRQLIPLLEPLIIKDKISEKLIRDAIEHLFDMGELIYFNDSKEFIILDVQWFVREVIAIFIRPDLVAKQQDRFELVEMKQYLLRISEEIYLDAIIDCLEKLGILYKYQEENNCTFVLVPALLQKSLPGWPQIDRDFFYFGRRYDCVEKKNMLLPSGIFTNLQVQLKQLYSDPYYVGDGWISFTTDTNSTGITFIIQIGGKKGLWTDRHWIDIMLRVSREHKENPEVGTEFSKLMDEVFRICAKSTCVELDEFVIRPQSVENLNISEEYDVVLSSRIKDKAKQKGPSCIHSWGARDLNDGSENTIRDLLFVHEWEHWKQDMMQKLEELKHMDKEIENLAGHDVKESMKGQHISTFSKDNSSSEIDPSSTRLEDKIDKILLEMGEIKNKVHAVMIGQKEIMSRLDELHDVVKAKEAKILQRLAILIEISEQSMPCLPYFTDDNNMIHNLTSDFFASSIKLHLLCESKVGGHHVVPGQKGIKVTVAAKWVIDCSKVLAPALTCLAFLLRMGAVAVGIPSVVPSWLPDVLKYIASELPFVQNFINKITGTACINDMLGTTANANDRELELQEFFKTLVRNGKEIDMKSDFGLQRIMFHDGKAAWVCDKHVQHGKVLSSTLSL